MLARWMDQQDMPRYNNRMPWNLVQLPLWD